MTKKNAFHVVTIERVGGGTTLWLARGRALDDVSVGDMIAIDFPDEHDAEQSLRFKVVDIKAYGKETPVLSRMVTGDLTLEGVNGDLIPQDVNLIFV